MKIFLMLFVFFSMCYAEKQILCFRDKPMYAFSISDYRGFDKIVTIDKEGQCVLFEGEVFFSDSKQTVENKASELKSVHSKKVVDNNLILSIAIGLIFIFAIFF